MAVLYEGRGNVLVAKRPIRAIGKYSSPYERDVKIWMVGGTLVAGRGEEW